MSVEPISAVSRARRVLVSWFCRSSRFVVVGTLAASCGGTEPEWEETTSAARSPACMASMDPFLNPFNKRSAHHRPIGADAVYASASDPATRDWNGANGMAINVGAPWGVSLADTDARDGVRTIAANPLKCDRVVGLPVSLRFPLEGFQTNVVMNASGCTDGVVVIYDRPAQKPHQLRQYSWNGGRPKAGQHKTWDIRGLGHGTRPGERVGTSASGVAAMFGLLRGHEVNTRGYKIQHVLQLVLPRTPGHCAMMLSRGIVYPAVSTDGSANQGNNNRGHIPYGGLIAIPPESKGGPNLDRLGLSEPGRRVVQALRDYGAIAVDGGNCAALRADQHVSAKVVSQIRADLSKVYRFMRLVKNTAPAQVTSGGGAPLAPNCAFDA